MTNEQLARFLWIWKINSVTSFLMHGGQRMMDARQTRSWIESDDSTFVCDETRVNEDFIFDQDFNDKPEVAQNES